MDDLDKEMAAAEEELAAAYAEETPAVAEAKGGKAEGGAKEGEGEEDELLAGIEKQMADYDNTLGLIQENIETIDKTFPDLATEDKADDAQYDELSVYVGQVDYNASAEELQAHFSSCGQVVRVTILGNRNGQPKGSAYVQFETKEGASQALLLHDSTFKGRKIQVMKKRINVPSAHRGGRGGYRG
eukprot:CAMPEP_0118878374 /NCGR_PEP_ID=MMETSP1163-20130328/18294_1 /TAXON_ID=124430 /ORGANISM="Phaeomonas parva, Strain CCMP2877" /LENGTH=185 /DNA_ID=CAMNT_0006814187 /DNA_START=340 /DNA_END=893 /DNA_ORIENTATION=+